MIEGAKTPFGADRRRAAYAHIRAAQAAGCDSLNSITVWLNGREVPTISGGRWHASTVRSILDQMALDEGREPVRIGFEEGRRRGGEARAEKYARLREATCA